MGRLTIGSYIIDSDSSNSTTSGVSLLLEDTDDALGYRVTGTSANTSIMWAQIQAASVAAFKTAHDALLDAITNVDGKDITYSEAGADVFAMLATDWPEIEGGVETSQLGDTSGLVAFSFTGARAGAPSGGAGDPTGLVEPLNWQYERTGGGIGACVCRGVFASTTSPTSSARQNAQAFADLLRDNTNFATVAPFLSTNFRVTDAIVELQQAQNQGSPVPESAYSQTVLTVTLKQLNEGVATWPDLVQSAEYVVSPGERPPMDERSGEGATENFALAGTLLLVTESSTAWDSGATKLATADIYTRARTAVDGIVAHVRAMYAAFALTQLGNPQISIDEPSGNVGFAVVFTSATVLEWNEEGSLKNTYSNKTRSRSDGGKDTEYETEGGPIKTFEHALTVVKLGAPAGYKEPFSRKDRNWSLMDITRAIDVRRAYGNGQVGVVSRGSSAWEFVNQTAADGDGSRQTVAGNALTYNTIGAGNL